MTTLYTLGTSTRSIDEFMEIIDQYEIRHVIDVRRFPTSRLEHFKKENLSKVLLARGISYTYLGDLLGGYRKEGYERYTESEPFQRGLRTAIDIASREPAVIICAERLPWRCHRRWIAQEAEKMGIEIIHIIEKERVWKPDKSLSIG